MNPAFMREAIRLSLEHMLAGNGGPFGAVVVRNGAIIGRGWNRVTSAKDPTAHAEIEAIREACRTLQDFRLSGAELYASCEPCPMCLSAIYWARLDRVFYACTRDDAAAAGFDDAHLYREVGRAPPERSLSMTQCLRDEALTAFAAWREKPDRTPY